mmetsp:Transcript_28970/g.83083  ORF Transcript_28970/g.83083 Transcript_28970/m.83083 type:complete len:555 (-) Transcript_28970:107-1771(-)
MAEEAVTHARSDATADRPAGRKVSLPIPSRLAAPPPKMTAVRSDGTADRPKSRALTLPISSRMAAPSAPEATSYVIAAGPCAGGRRSVCRYTSSRPLELDYTFEGEVLGYGMSGPVCLATGRGDGQKYAVKTFRKAGISARQLDDFKSEVEIYLSLDHPHIARLEMVYETSEEIHLVMEHMAGGELYDRLRQQQRYGEEEAAETLQQIMLAVAYLHSHKIAHRDLKLENFLYERKDSNRLKLIDFGLAKLTEQSTRMTQSCGSLYYIAPEVLARSYTEKADMWSVGVIACMVLTGSPPFIGDDEEVLGKIRYGEVDWPSVSQNLSSSARDFIGGLLVAEPALRMSAQQALSHPWIKARPHVGTPLVGTRMVSNLRHYCRASKFQRNVLSMIAWSLSTGDLAELSEQFLLFDQDCGGTISLQELKDALGKFVGIESAEAEEIFGCLDADRNEEVEYSEFLAALLPGVVKVCEDSLRRAFRRFDADGDGHISCEELGCALGDREEVECALREADTSGDGRLDYDEFLAFIQRSEPELCSESKPLESVWERPTFLGF